MSKKEVKFNCKIVKCMYNSEDYKIYATDVDKKSFPILNIINMIMLLFMETYII